MRRRVFAGLTIAACVVILAWTAPSAAQPRGPRPAPVHGPAGGPAGPRVGVGFYYGPYYGPYFYNPWFYSAFWWYPPYAYGYPYYFGAVGANLRVQVQPKSAEVYVDGHRAGIVDQFDGMFQNLVVEPGSREITIYLEGYRSIVERLYLSVGTSYKIKGTMEKLAPGAPSEPRPVPAPPPPAAQAQYQAPPPAPSSPAPPANTSPGGSRPAASGDARFGQVAIRVQPADAELVIDGEAWNGPQGAERLVVHLPPGTHRVEIRKDGFDAFVTAVEVKKGEVAVLNVSLAKL
jgi:hypothetical protein